MFSASGFLDSVTERVEGVVEDTGRRVVDNAKRRAVDGASALASKSVDSVTVRSQVLPTLRFEVGASGGQGGPSTGGALKRAALSLAKPSVEVSTAAGPLRSEPYGRPSEGVHWPYTKATGVALGGLAVLGLWKGMELAKWVALGAAVYGVTSGRLRVPGPT